MCKKSYSEIYLMAVEKANGRCCPDCESEGSLHFADEEVLVCDVCQYSIEAEDLEPVWQDKIEDDEGFYDLY